MKQTIQLSIAVIVTVAVAIPLFAQSEIDPFYQRRLDAGKAAWANGDYYQAVDDLRIAAFGLLDDLDVLSETLARLAVAQQAAGMTEESIETVRRFVDVEEVAAAFPSYALEAGVESALETLIRTSVPNERLSEVRSLSRFYTSDEDRVMGLSGRAKTRALEESVAKDPGNSRWYLLLANDALERRSMRDAATWIDRGLEAIPRDRGLLQMRADLHLRADDCEAAWRTVEGMIPFPGDLGESIFLCLTREGNGQLASNVLLQLEKSNFPLSPAAERARDDLRRTVEAAPAAKAAAPAEKPLPPIIDEEPARRSEPVAQPQTESDVIAEARALATAGRVAEGKEMLLGISGAQNSRDLDLALLEAAVLSADWPLARQKIRTLTPFQRSEPASVFYAAVTLYESDRRDDARRLFEYARPRISDSELVTRYERLILAER